jgi:hypothetical protein
MKALLLIVSILVTPLLAADKPGAMDYLTLSAGTWIVTNDNTGMIGKNSYFQSLKITCGYHIGKMKGTISIPIAFTTEKYADSLRYAVYPGNQELTFGIRVYNVSPRIGIVFPLGYPVRGTAWIGSGNIKLLLGSGFKIGEYFNKKISVGGDFSSSICLTDTADGARFGRGSVSGYISVGTSMRFKKYQPGISLMLLGSNLRYSDWGGRESSLSFMPSISCSRSISKKMTLSARVGAGTGKSGTNWERSQINSSASISLYRQL